MTTKCTLGWLFLGALASLGSPAAAGTITVTPAWQGPAVSQPRGLELRLMADQSLGWRTLVTHPLEGLAPLTISAPPGKVWVVVSGPDAWAASQAILVPEAPVAAHVNVAVWPGGLVEGRLRRAPGETGPLDLKLRFSPAPGAKGPPATFDRCIVKDDSTFQCRVPALELDLRLRAEPYITHYRWGLKVPRGGTAQIGELKLERGASLVGWVATEDGSPITPTAHATLEPAGLATPITTDVTPRDALLRREAPVNDRGFFHFDGLAPGEYLVTASQAPFGPASSPASVLADTEAELGQPLLLAKPETLELAVQPPQTPWGDPWRALLFRSDRRSQRGERVRAETLPLDGFIKLEGLPKGQYVLQILAHESQAWAIRGIELGKEGMPVTVQIQALRVEGEVLLGDDPVPAKVIFGGRFGGMQVTAEADEEGHFATMLPRPGEWDVDIDAQAPRMYVALSKVKVEPKPNEAAARVRLELPDTHLKVEVVDEAGRPAQRALVNVDPNEAAMKARMTQEWTDAGGRAELHGLPAGQYFIQASAGPGLESDNTPAQLAEGAAGPLVRLTLRERKRVQVKILGRGQPVPGAQTVLFPIMDIPVGASLERTDALGEVELRLPPSVRAINALVEAPGYAFRLAALPVPAQGPLTIELEPQMGTLRLRAPIPGDSLRPHAYLLRQGGRLDWAFVPQVSRQPPSGKTLRDELVLPNAEPGDWALCPGGNDGALPALSAACVSGVLAPNGTLELTLE